MDNLTLKQLRYVVAVADHQSFSKAAVSVNVTQPGLSQQVRQMERELGVALFERVSRSVRPTPAGEEVIARARHLLGLAGDLVLAASLHRGAPRGTLRLGAVPAVAPYLLGPLAAALRQQWPDAEMEMQERQTADLIRALAGGGADLGLLAPPGDAGGLRVEEVRSETFYLAVPADCDLADPEPLAVRPAGRAGFTPLAALTDLPMLLGQDHGPIGGTAAACGPIGPAGIREMPHAGLSTLAQMVSAGAGVTLLPGCAVPVEARPGAGVAARPLDPPVPACAVALAWRPTDPRGGHFAEAAERLRSDGGWAL